MIFKPRLAHLILVGKKTMTRRPVREGELECRYQVGSTYAIQRGRGKPAVGRLRVLSVHEELLHEMDPLDALAEGFRSRDEFFDYWRELYGTGPLIKVPVWVIAFELVGTDEPRLLHRDSMRGYTSDPKQAFRTTEGKTSSAGQGDAAESLTAVPHPELEDSEPECVDEQSLARFATESEQDRVARQARYEQRVKERALEDRLAEARALAAEQGTDISRLEARIAKGVEALERKVHQDRAA